MWDIGGEVSRAVESLGVKAELLTSEESRELWGLVAAAYAGGSKKWPLWEHLQDCVGVQIEDASHKLSEFLGPVPVLPLFEPSDALRQSS